MKLDVPKSSYRYRRAPATLQELFLKIRLVLNNHWNQLYLDKQLVSDQHVEVYPASTEAMLIWWAYGARPAARSAVTNSIPYKERILTIT